MVYGIYNYSYWGFVNQQTSQRGASHCKIVLAQSSPRETGAETKATPETMCLWLWRAASRGVELRGWGRVTQRSREMERWETCGWIPVGWNWKLETGCGWTVTEPFYYISWSSHLPFSKDCSLAFPWAPWAPWASEKTLKHSWSWSTYLGLFEHGVNGVYRCTPPMAIL